MVVGRTSSSCRGRGTDVFLVALLLPTLLLFTATVSAVAAALVAPVTATALHPARTAGPLVGLAPPRPALPVSAVAAHRHGAAAAEAAAVAFEYDKAQMVSIEVDMAPARELCYSPKLQASTMTLVLPTTCTRCCTSYVWREPIAPHRRLAAAAAAGVRSTGVRAAPSCAAALPVAWPRAAHSFKARPSSAPSSAPASSSECALRLRRPRREGYRTVQMSRSLADRAPAGFGYPLGERRPRAAHAPARASLPLNQFVSSGNDAAAT